MLSRISINNIVLIEKLEIDFKSGFTVFTGETGAGKSIILGSLSLVLGERAEGRMLRAGASQGSVSAEFDISGGNNSINQLLAEHGIPEEENQIRLKRILYADGKSRAFVNDEAAGVNLLKKIAANLVEIHGQHEHTLLFDVTQHRTFLDRYGKVEKELKRLEDCFAAWRSAEDELAAARSIIAKAQVEEEYLRHIHKELGSLAPQPGEEETLAEKRSFLMNSERLAETLNSAIKEMTANKNVPESLRSAQRYLYRSKFAETTFAEAVQALEKAASEADEALAILENLAEKLESNPALLEKTEERLFALKDAARKYQRPVSELENYLEEITAKLQIIDSGEKNIDELVKKAGVAKAAYAEASKDLSGKRLKAAGKMEQAISAELKPLKMGGCVFKVDIKQLPEENWGSHGFDKISFLVETNPGSGLHAINKIASGGELSRLMLALRVVLQETKSAATMIFDEVDSGIGGAVADAAGSRLAKLGKKVQVFAVTHQPQVAAYADQHLLIYKEKKSGELKTIVKLLDGSERKEELARMLAGAKITDQARAAAGALIAAK